MKTIFTIIAMPISIFISIICFLFVLLFTRDFKEKNGVGVIDRMRIESRNLLLMEAWESVPAIWRGIISIAVYYMLFF